MIVKNINDDLLIHDVKSYGILGSKFGVKYILNFDNSKNEIHFGRSKLVWVLSTESGTKSLREAKKREGQKKEMKNLQNTINSLGAIYVILWS